MTPERWREIERLFYAALERPADDDERAALLDDECGTDEELRREIESLFAYEAKARDFIETPTSEVHLRLLSCMRNTFRSLDGSSAPGRFVGRALGVYELKALVGAGGMGEVYRALDTRLNRTVAIKVLLEQVSNDPERRERFRREAKIVSSLNHPHICALYDVGVEDEVHYLVMEYVDGETLQYQLERATLPLARVLEYSIQICDALDKAHRRGVIHRDLKPANVMLTKSGVKLLDFGAATWGAPVAGMPSEHPGVDGSGELTGEGVILGTLQYASPERLEGKQADGRTDIFAFGALAHEMVTGKKAFLAASQAGLIGAILRDEVPPVSDLVPHVPASLAQTISRCLCKDPDERWQTARDLLFQLRSVSSTSPAVPEKKPTPRKLSVERVAWTMVILASVVATSLWVRGRDLGTTGPSDPTPMATAIRFALFPAADTVFHPGYGVPFALSPDGRKIVYVGDRADGTRQLWLRSLDSGDEQAMPGTEGASTPFWSPDSQWIGFFAENSLKKARVPTGLVQVIGSNVLTYGGAAWNADDVILFPATGAGLSRISAQGGSISLITKRDREGAHFWPQFLSDGRHFIYAAGTSRVIWIGSLGNERPRMLMRFPLRMSSLAHTPGYIFFVQDAALFVRAFDEERLEFAGEAVQIADGIPVMGPGRSSFSVSAAGVLAYWTYAIGMPTVLRWFDRDGRTSPAVDGPAKYVGFALSSDARQLTFSRMAKDGSTDVWLRDLSLGNETRLTFDGAAFTPQWSPDQTLIVFSSPGQDPPPKLFITNVTGSLTASPIGDSQAPNFASSWSADGRSIVSVRLDPRNRNDLWIQRLPDGAGERLSFNTAANESDGKVSPDGRWIAYVTDESGRNEVWVTRFPSGTVKRQVSVGGGTSPQWGGNGKELFYISADRKVVATAINVEHGDMDIGTPQVLFQVDNLAEVDRLFYPTANRYVATLDGQRFLAAVHVREPDVPPISVVVNWPALLKH